MKILLGDFNAKVGRYDIFKPAVRNDSDWSCYSRWKTAFKCKLMFIPLEDLTVIPLSHGCKNFIRS